MINDIAEPGVAEHRAKEIRFGQPGPGLGVTGVPPDRLGEERNRLVQTCRVTALGVTLGPDHLIMCHGVHAAATSHRRDPRRCQRYPECLRNFLCHGVLEGKQVLPDGVPGGPDYPLGLHIRELKADATTASSVTHLAIEYDVCAH